MGNNCQLGKAYFCCGVERLCDFFKNRRSCSQHISCEDESEGYCNDPRAHAAADNEQNESFQERMTKVEKALTHIGDPELSKSDFSTNGYDLAAISKELIRRGFNG